MQGELRGAARGVPLTECRLCGNIMSVAGGAGCAPARAARGAPGGRALSPIGSSGAPRPASCAARRPPAPPALLCNGDAVPPGLPLHLPRPALRRPGRPTRDLGPARPAPAAAPARGLPQCPRSRPAPAPSPQPHSLGSQAPRCIYGAPTVCLDLSGVVKVGTVGGHTGQHGD